MTGLDVAIDVVQFTALLAVSAANGVIAYSVFRLQKDRNTPKLVLYVELVENDDHTYYGLYVQNVGLVPAVNIRVTADIEEWREGKPVQSRFHKEFQAFQDHHVSLNPQEYKVYELPWMEGWGLVITVVVSCSNGSSDSMHFAVGDDRYALRHVAFGKGRKSAIKRLESQAAIRNRESRDLHFVLGLTSLKDYDELFGDKADSP